jgi:hypothetical protein
MGDEQREAVNSVVAIVNVCDTSSGFFAAPLTTTLRIDRVYELQTRQQSAAMSSALR